MQYITGYQAFNLKSSLRTCGPISEFHYFGRSKDWTYVSWDTLNFSESENSIFGDYGIEVVDNVPKHDGKYFVANHCRALLDFLSVLDTSSLILGARYFIIDNDEYNGEFFKQVIKLKGMAHWDVINQYVGFEYGLDWLEFLISNEIVWPYSVWSTNRSIGTLTTDSLRNQLRELACDFILSLNLNVLELYLSKILEHEASLTPGTYKDIRYFFVESIVDHVDYCLLTQPFANKRKLAKTISKVCKKVGLSFKSKIFDEKWKQFI